MAAQRMITLAGSVKISRESFSIVDGHQLPSLRREVASQVLLQQGLMRRRRSRCRERKVQLVSCRPDFRIPAKSWLVRGCFCWSWTTENERKRDWALQITGLFIDGLVRFGPAPSAPLYEEPTVKLAQEWTGQRR